MEIRNILRKFGLETMFFKFFYILKIDKTKGGKYLPVDYGDRKTTKNYFMENKNEIADVLSYLADDESKEVYKKMIMFRQTLKPSDLAHFKFENQYFVRNIVNLSNDEVFVDCGAYDGDTIEKFYKMTHGNYRCVVAFEPDVTNFNHLHEKTKEYKKPVYAFRSGVWDKTGILSFTTNNGEESKVDSLGDVKIDVVNLDSVEECKDATFIKMDIEGSELNALNGARQIIEKNHPKLAICIYHSDKDMIEIPKWIHYNFPFYALYIRHHSFSMEETVLYAIPNKIVK